MSGITGDDSGPEDNAEWLRWAADVYASAVAKGGSYAPEPNWDVSAISPGLRGAAAEIERLRARVEVLERDASRYQWLKNRKWMSLQTSYMKWIRKDSTSFIASHDLAADGTQYAPYETLDETIDAAMKKAKP